MAAPAPAAGPGRGGTSSGTSETDATCGVVGEVASMATTMPLADPGAAAADPGAAGAMPRRGPRVRVRKGVCDDDLSPWGEPSRSVPRQIQLDCETCTEYIEDAAERAINVKKLASNKSFSSETYGELLPPFIDMLIRQYNISRSDVVVDLGSGAGQLCLQIAAMTGARVWGIEIREGLVQMARELHREFLRTVCRKRVGLRGHGFTLRLRYSAGDFTLPKYLPELKEATIVIINNYVFSPELNNAVMERFQDLRPGTLVVSMRSFCGRHSDVRCSAACHYMGRPETFDTPEDSLSWDCAQRPYFVYELGMS